jgi:hypothetical protein
LEQQAQERDTTARDANSDRMTFAAQLGRISADALRIDLAISILEIAIERLRSVPDDGIAGHIGKIFARLSGGACTALEVDRPARAASRSRRPCSRHDYLGDG